ncbi:MAG: HAMP domain-containing protein [Phycisphaerales bacterium JB038]
MLRQKLMLTLGVLVVVLLGATVTAALLLQDVLNDMSHINDVAINTTTNTCALSTRITAIEVELNELRLLRKTHLDHLITETEALRREVTEMGEIYLMREEGQENYERLCEVLPDFLDEVGALATTQDPELSTAHADAALVASIAVRKEIAALVRIAQGHAGEEQQSVTRKFRRTLLGVLLVFLIVINVAIVLLFRAAGMVLKPIDELVEASRRLAKQEFDHRVELRGNDEFDELGRAHNRLAAELQQMEQRKLEALQQMGRTLRHELNNAMAIISLQVELAERTSSGTQDLVQPLTQIRDTLERIRTTVDGLTQIRRIVLTEYLAGTQMLDLERSIGDDSHS